MTPRQERFWFLGMGFIIGLNAGVMWAMGGYEFIQGWGRMLGKIRMARW